ncbi:hypothetical protein PR202_gb12674 [Eleusine coracana subsp. coracana]|uniref:Uncharacterized protein n=1 Tax=Eleusine coracana subsp. coracana TaxID=191504 RepID=A0AAV5ENG1_ELECO|nr:hypothetical protein PR202_gb12674 [Eleusine coracana subsp. coracana]
MAAMARSPLLLVAALVSVFFSHAAGILTLDPVQADVTAGDDGTKVYIVFTERQPTTVEMPELEASAAVSSFHHDMLSDLLNDSSSVANRIVYHYSRSLHGFAARLTEDERNRLAGNEDVISIHEKKVYWPHTTRSWNFLDLPQHNDPARLKFEKDVVIGMVDSGIFPESASFSDAGLPPPPSKWKGVCTSNFTCTNKIIGARAYKDGNRTVSPVDTEGHGTHTSSTAAGRAVAGASMGGVAGGTARGAVPGARLAVYKVCWDDGCGSEDIVAAFDDAVADGVDVISASLGSGRAWDYSEDPIAVGAVSNVAPWAVSVAATTTDRKIVSEMVLGNGKRVVGLAVTAFRHLEGDKPALLVNPGSCAEETLMGRRYRGAVLMCDDPIDPAGFKDTGAVAAIRPHPSSDVRGDTARAYPIPAVIVTEEQYKEIQDFYNTTRLPMVTVKNSATVKDESAPTVASFSSRGPNMVTHGIIKPDISAPGVDILAAWTGLTTATGSKVDNRRVAYNIVSGTSMACPHVTGAAAYVKSVHPDWSPAAVLSAIVTTATPVVNHAPEAELAFGAGLVNPMGVRYPGIVYDAGEADYLAFLCAQGYNATQLATMTGTKKTTTATCKDRTATSVGDLNYPSIAVPVINYGVPFAAEFPRRVTNVGPAASVYRAKVVGTPAGVKITVAPEELAFSEKKQTLGFKVSVSGTLTVNGTIGASAALVWSDGKHLVRSPIYVFPHKLYYDF